jgi:hypothetical protein
MQLAAMNPSVHFRITERTPIGNLFIVSFPSGLGSVFNPPPANSNNPCDDGKD